MKFVKRIILIFSGIVLISVVFILCFFFKRETKEWTENIVVAKNTEISVELMSSQRGYYGGHGLGWGGGDDKNNIKFVYNDIKYFHETPYIPVIIKMDKEYFYLVYYNRTDMKNITYNFYKSTKKGSFEEIKAVEFPKHIAIQNRWFNGADNAENLIGLNPKKILGTMTVTIWYKIDGNRKKFDSYIDFIKEYKEKYITNREEE